VRAAADHVTLSLSLSLSWSAVPPNAVAVAVVVGQSRGTEVSIKPFDGGFSITRDELKSQDKSSNLGLTPQRK
jgi:hypothetical protein